MFLEVLSPGWLTTVQDLGRVGYERYGIPRSGAMDWFSLRAANRLVGNSASEAGLEFLSEGPVMRADEDCLVAVTGRGFRPVIHDRPVGMWRCALVRRNETIRISAEDGSGWGYLAVNGGVLTPPVMGSRSTYLRGGLGGYQGRVLQAGDRLPVGGGLPRYWQRLAGRALKASSRLLFSDTVEAAVVPGPQDDVFFEPERNGFYQDTYQILPTSDRMGYRLSGPAVQRRVVKELVSEGIAAGSVQVPPDGQPIILMSDRPTTGGYAKIATVATASLPLVAQAIPGRGKVRFRAVSVEESQRQYQAMIEAIEKGVPDEIY